MRVVITGASGNVGTSVVRTLGADPNVREIVGVARRRPDWNPDKTTWVEADVAADPLEPIFAGADAVVHLAWLIQPSRDSHELGRVNVEGSRRVFEAAAATARALVYASSVGAYSPGPKDREVDESWPTGGIASSYYSRHKVACERILDEVEGRHRGLRVVRLRPALIFKGEAGTEIRHYFAGPLLPPPLVRPGLVRIVPRVPRLRFQAVHSDDVADAYRLAVVREQARGAYNVAADPVLDPGVLAREFGALQLPVSARVLRALTALTWRAHLQPTAPGWLDMALGVPLLSTQRLRLELGWEPRHSSLYALRELLDGMSRRKTMPTPPLRAASV